MARCKKRALRIERFIRAIAGNTHDVPKYLWLFIQEWGRQIRAHYIVNEARVDSWQSIKAFVIISQQNWEDVSPEQRYNAARFLADRGISKRLWTEEDVQKALLSKGNPNDLRI